MCKTKNSLFQWEQQTVLRVFSAAFVYEQRVCVYTYVFVE